MFAQTTAEPLNGGPRLSQKPEYTTGGAERRSIGLYSLCAYVCMCLSECVSVCALTGRHTIIDPHDYRVREQVGVSIRGGNCVTVRMCTDERLQITWSSVLLALKEAGQLNHTATSSGSNQECVYIWPCKDIRLFKLHTEVWGNFS